MPATPLSYCGDWPVGTTAIAVGMGFTVMSNTTPLLLPLAINRVLPSAVIASPSGADNGVTPLARTDQHLAPGNPPKLPSAPKPRIDNVPDLHPNLERIVPPLASSH